MYTRIILVLLAIDLHCIYVKADLPLPPPPPGYKDQRGPGLAGVKQTMFEGALLEAPTNVASSGFAYDFRTLSNDSSLHPHLPPPTPTNVSSHHPHLHPPINVSSHHTHLPPPINVSPHHPHLPAPTDVSSSDPDMEDEGWGEDVEEEGYVYDWHDIPRAVIGSRKLLGGAAHHHVPHAHDRFAEALQAQAVRKQSVSLFNLRKKLAAQTHGQRDLLSHPPQTRKRVSHK